MDSNEAREILHRHLAGYRGRTYAELVGMIGQLDVAEISGTSGAKYQIEIQVLWDDKAHDRIRVQAGIDDGGWRAWVPISGGFIMAADGSFLGE